MVVGSTRRESAHRLTSATLLKDTSERHLRLRTASEDDGLVRFDLVARLRFLFVRPCAARSSAQVTWTRGRGHPTVPGARWRSPLALTSGHPPPIHPFVFEAVAPRKLVSQLREITFPRPPEGTGKTLLIHPGDTHALGVAQIEKNRYIAHRRGQTRGLGSRSRRHRPPRERWEEARGGRRPQPTMEDRSRTLRRSAGGCTKRLGAAGTRGTMWKTASASPPSGGRPRLVADHTHKEPCTKIARAGACSFLPISQ